MASPSISTQGAFKSEGDTITDGIIHQKDQSVNREFSDGVKKRVKKVSDKDYLDAVNRGDMETVKRMVEEAAREAGYQDGNSHHIGVSRALRLASELADLRTGYANLHRCAINPNVNTRKQKDRGAKTPLSFWSR